MAPREKDFRIGCVHGHVQTHPSSVEAQLRNDLYLIGMLRIEKTSKLFVDIRLMAYEMPLECGACSRVRCVDLVGYDQEYRPWIIELKQPNSTEKIDEEVMDQLNGYAAMFTAAQCGVEAEIQQKFHWPDFKFVGEPGKMILSGREFFKKQTMFKAIIPETYCCSFSRIRKPKTDAGDQINLALLAKNLGKGIVRLSIENHTSRRLPADSWRFHEKAWGGNEFKKMFGLEVGGVENETFQVIL